MINKTSFTKEWIETINSNKGKTEIIEKEIYALYLLECLSRTKIDFIFKGGTSLMLMFDDIKRFSTDIDILVKESNLEPLIDNFDNFKNDKVFLYYEENKRIYKGIKKRHFKFYYNSKIFDRKNYIILDIVYEDIPYTETIERLIVTQILKIDEPHITVKTPNITNILVDKLTAFAPNTIGITYNSEKYTEIIKQLYDVSLLFNECTNFNNINTLYHTMAKLELKHRTHLINTNVNDCLSDSIETSKIILSKGGTNSDKYKKLLNGIKGFSNFINENFSITNTYEYATNVYILCLIIKCGSIKKYKYYANNIRKEKIKASFISRTYKELRFILNDKYLELEEAIKIENFYFIPVKS